MKPLLVFSAALILFILSACTPEVICTMDFRAVMVEIPGIELDETITIDQTTDKTVVVSSAPYGSEIYTVFSDKYLSKLKNKEHSFRFLGLMEGDTLIDQAFEIGANDCHIYKISGPDRIEK